MSVRGPCGCNPYPGITCAHGFTGRDGPYFQGGPHASGPLMAAAAAAIRDVGGLPADASLIFTQLLLNLAGHAGYGQALILINNFLAAADAPTTVVPRR